MDEPNKPVLKMKSLVEPSCYQVPILKAVYSHLMQIQAYLTAFLL